MATEVYRTADVKGLAPAIDPTRSNEQFALNGRNYIFDSLGPKSAFGNRLLLPHRFEEPAHWQSIRLKLRDRDRVFTLTNQAVLEWSEDEGGWRILYVLPDTSQAPYRWTWGYLSGAMFFCHPVSGILFYSIENDVMGSLLTVPGAPTDALAICVDNGRLVAVTPEYLQWSDPSDGFGWTPQLGGAGFQQLAARVPGYPIMVTNYARGVLTWTTGGILRSEFTGDQEVYRHRQLNTEYRPINSFCIFKQDDDTAVILDSRGLFQTRGEEPTPFAPVFNEFLVNYLQDNGFELGDNVRLEWDDRKRLLYLSLSESRYDPIYEKAFVLYPPLDKWGQFNESHYGIGAVRIETGERYGDYFGFVDAEGRCRYWKETGSRESLGEHQTDNLYYPVLQAPFHYELGEDSIVLGSAMGFSTFDTTQTPQVAGYYAMDGSTPVPPTLMGLNASIQMGLFRQSENLAHDEMGEITQVLVRSSQSGPTDRTSGEYNIAPPMNDVIDYTMDESQIYALEEINYVNHELRVIGTNDGVTLYVDEEPSLVGFSRGARHYSCSVPGIWHIVELRAESIGEAFHLKTLELTATSAGRLL